MSTLEIKGKILNYIDHADDKVLKAIYTLLESTIDDYSLTSQQMAEVERRREHYLSGKSKTHTWQKAKSLIGKKT